MLYLALDRSINNILLRRIQILRGLRHRRRLHRRRLPHRTWPFRFSWPPQELAFPFDDRLNARTQSHPHVQVAGPQKSLVEDANTPADIRWTIFA